MLRRLLDDTVRQSEGLTSTAHRPYPMPSGRYAMGQTWRELVFAHWRVAAADIQPLLPAGLEVDEHDGSAWVGVTPFVVTGVRPRGGIPVPFLSTFNEFNVRTYVRYQGRPGIWFFSLNTPSRGAIAAARRFYRLPYHYATMDHTRDGRWIDTAARRPADGAQLSLRCKADGRVFHARNGTLEYFLAERYCLYTEDEGTLYRAEIHHPPWPLQVATGTVRHAALAPDPVTLEGEPELLHLAYRQDVVLWPIEPVAGDGGSRGASAP